MTTLLQISDAHFGTEQPPVVQALLKLADEQTPDIVVFSGDITQRARGAQFRAAREFIDRMKPKALVAIPGNHDIPLFNVLARAVSPYSGYTRVFGKNLEPEWESPNLLVVCVNTTRPERHVDGEISDEQIARVSKRVGRASASQLRVVVVHQPVLAIREQDLDNLLHGHRQAIPAWSAAGVDIIMGGHIHLPYIRSLLTTFPMLPRDMWTVQAGTCVSSRIREGMTNSVNIIRCSGASTPRRCEVERWDFTPTLACFERHTVETLRFTDA